MNLTLHIRALVLVFLCFCQFSKAQDNVITLDQQGYVPSEKDKEYNRKTFICAFDVFGAIPTGDNYAGKFTDGKAGFNLKAALTYKGVFAGFVSQTSYIDITSPRETGFYDKTTISGTGLMLGYEISPFQNVNIGLSFTLFGKARYHNTHFTNGDEAEFTDRAKMNLYELNVDYIVSKSFAFYFYYGFRDDRLEIAVPEEINQNFERAKFHNLGIGLKFRFSTIFSRWF